jgi:hypothetical protein
LQESIKRELIFGLIFGIISFFLIILPILKIYEDYQINIKLEREYQKKLKEAITYYLYHNN